MRKIIILLILASCVMYGTIPTGEKFDLTFNNKTVEIWFDWHGVMMWDGQEWKKKGEYSYHPESLNDVSQIWFTIDNKYFSGEINFFQTITGIVKVGNQTHLFIAVKQKRLAK